VSRKHDRLSARQTQANRYDIVSRLADDLAHEIRNPVNSIVIGLEVLRVQLDRGDTDGARRRTAVIEEEVRRLHHLIDRLLLLIRPERTPADSVTLDTVLDEILPLIEAKVRLARNSLVADCPASIIVPAPRDALRLALLNLFIAIHDRLGEGGGTLTCRCTADGDTVRLLVAAETAADATFVPGSGRGVEAAAAVAAALLHGYGTLIGPDENGVTIVLSRATPGQGCA
jgi:signal transduction histidine kinase